MKTLWLEKEMLYDGTQLKSLYTYLNHKVMGDSIVSWVGPCNVTFEHMVDGEDLIAQEKICGSQMLHFIIEVFHQNLFSAVAMQRLFASLAKDLLEEFSHQKILRKGDDLFFNEGKLSISIASSTPVSQMIHFAINISNAGTPVKTAALCDLKLEAQTIALRLMQKFSQEYEDILAATTKVRPLL